MSAIHRAPSPAENRYAVSKNPWVERRNKVFLVAALAMLPLSLGRLMTVPNALQGLGAVVLFLCVPVWVFCAVKAGRAGRR